MICKRSASDLVPRPRGCFRAVLRYDGITQTTCMLSCKIYKLLDELDPDHPIIS
jgi:hypothetical protein